MAAAEEHPSKSGNINRNHEASIIDGPQRDVHRKSRGPPGYKCYAVADDDGDEQLSGYTSLCCTFQ